MTWTTLFWLIGAVFAGLFTFSAMRLWVYYLRVRTHELQAATTALDEYENAIELLVRDPATPQSILDFVLKIDPFIGDRDVARRFVVRVFTGRASILRGNSRDDDDDAVIKDFKELGKHRKDLQEAFTNVVANGFVATMFKWPLSARAYRLVLIDPRRDPVTPANALSDGGHMPHAMAA